MANNHFKQLNSIRKEKGLKAALEFDVKQTLRRHPTLRGLVVAGAITFSGYKQEPEVYVDFVEKDDGNQQTRIQGLYPASIALGNRWISKEVYQYVMGRGH